MDHGETMKPWDCREKNIEWEEHSIYKTNILRSNSGTEQSRDYKRKK